jgi:ATP-dependent Lon protease
MRKVTRKVLSNKDLKVSITKDNINDYLGKEKYHFITNNKNPVGVVNGLAYTPFGGVILPIDGGYTCV